MYHSNDVTARLTRWRRLPGDEWDCYDALPEPVRRRLQEHAYDGWAANALRLWRGFRCKQAQSAAATRRLLRYLDECERAELEGFAADYRAAFGTALPHEAAGATRLRYGRPVTPAA